MAKKNNIVYNKIKIGNMMKSIRKSRGLTQEQVAEQLGLAPRYISDIERDKTKGSIDTLVKLCNIYHITPTYVLRDFLNSEEIQIDSGLIGFYQLSEHDKDVIRQLISYMNKKNNQKNNNQ